MHAIEDQVSIDAISARDADERAARLHNGVEALELLQRAQANGDTVLAHAILTKARRASQLNSAARTEWAAVIQFFTTAQTA